jgi:hypothetical protein
MNHQKRAVFLLLLIAPLFVLAAQPPKPYDVSGFVLQAGGIQAESGLPVWIKNTATGNVWEAETGIEVPGQTGFYSLVLQGNKNDWLTLRAWNSTSYAEVQVQLDKGLEVNLTLNLTRPPELNISIVLPENSSLFNMSEWLLVNASVIVLGGYSAENCSLNIVYNESILSHSGESSRNYAALAYGYRFFEVWNLSTAWIGATSIRVFATCDTDSLLLLNKTSDSVYNITIRDPFPPNITLLFPQNNSYKNYTEVTVQYTVSDHLNISNCSIEVSNGFSDTDYDVAKDDTNSFSVGFDEGAYTWNITCFDTSSPKNRGFSGSSILYIDLTDPELELLLPSNGSLFNHSDKVRIQADAEDNFNLSYVVLNISWPNASMTANLTFNATTGLFEYDFINTTTLGVYQFSLTAYDLSDRQAVRKGNFKVLGVDFWVNLSSLPFPNSSVEFSSIPLSTRVYCYGNKNASNVNVSFYRGGELLGSTSFDYTSQAYVDVSINWTAEIGTSLIEVVVDPPLATNGSVLELNESNNYQSKPITVEAYHLFFGNATYEVVLSTEANSSFSSWNGKPDFRGRVYAADSDSAVDWGVLVALGRTVLGGVSAGDFELLDTVLNMTGLADSINSTFTAGGAPRAVTTLEVFDKQVANVPTVNSTAHPGFSTGILWDASGEAGAYDGTQPIVFVANINVSAQGMFGTYDYELKVPARLRQYHSPNLDNSISLFYEMA